MPTKFASTNDIIKLKAGSRMTATKTKEHSVLTTPMSMLAMEKCFASPTPRVNCSSTADTTESTILRHTRAKYGIVTNSDPITNRAMATPVIGSTILNIVDRMLLSLSASSRESIANRNAANSS